uniref:De novo design protein n=1 Tax=synthetic construct TaxID=32630 RepID=UPI0034C6DF76
GSAAAVEAQIAALVAAANAALAADDQAAVRAALAPLAELAKEHPELVAANPEVQALLKALIAKFEEFDLEVQRLVLAVVAELTKDNPEAVAFLKAAGFWPHLAAALRHPDLELVRLALAILSSSLAAVEAFVAALGLEGLEADLAYLRAAFPDSPAAELIAKVEALLAELRAALEHHHHHH